MKRTIVDIIFVCHNEKENENNDNKNPHQKKAHTGLITVYNFESDEICDLKWKTTSPKMEDDLTQNGRRPHPKWKTTKNGRRPK